MKAEIISIGSEIVSGQSLDTNSQWLSRALGELGVAVHYHTTLNDALDENVASVPDAVTATATSTWWNMSSGTRSPTF